MRFDTSALVAKLEAQHAADPGMAVLDLAVLATSASSTFKAAEFDGLGLLGEWTQSLPANFALWGEFSKMGFLLASSTSGTAGADKYLGNADANIFNGGSGDDWIYGGAGNDVLNGGDGSDTFVFSRGFGQDTINQSDSSAGRMDQLQFTDLSSSDLIGVTRSGNDLILSFNSGDSVRLYQFYYQDSYTFYKIDKVSFADDVEWSRSDLINRTVTVGSVGNDAIGGTNLGINTINGLAGSDSLWGGNFADRLDGGEGNDTLEGLSGDDLLIGGQGNDRLNGGAGNDTLIGSEGNDVLDGGDGSDTFVFSRGFGQDTINQRDSSAGRVDQLQFTDLTSQDLSGVMRSGSDLILSFNSGDSVRVSQFYYSDSYTAYKIDKVSFADGVEWNQRDLINRTVWTGSAGNDQISGDNLRTNTIHGLAGNDTLAGGSLADRLDGGDGSDTLNGGAGDDALIGGQGNDTLYGDAGDDIIDGGMGDDVLYGGVGRDTFRFGRGYGADRISSSDATANQLDTADLFDIASSEVSVQREGAVLVIRRLNSQDVLNIDYFFSDTGAVSTVKELQFSDGVKWDVDRIRKLVLQGADGNDTLTGYATSDDVSGGSGDDTLYGNAGNDTLTGGVGNDTLNGGIGNDTYLFSRGDGKDTVSDCDTTAGNKDVAAFASDIGADQLWFSRSGSNLDVRIIGTDDVFSIGNWYAGTANHIEQFKAGDGRILINTQVDLLVQAMASFAPPASGQTTLPANYQSSLGTLVATSWN